MRGELDIEKLATWPCCMNLCSHHQIGHRCKTLEVRVDLINNSVTYMIYLDKTEYGEYSTLNDAVISYNNLYTALD